MDIHKRHEAVVAPRTSDGIIGCCAYGQMAMLADGRIGIVYREGTTKHSLDGILRIQYSADYGQSWTEPQTIFDGRHDSPPRSIVTAGLAQLPGGRLVCTAFWTRAAEGDLYLFSEEGRNLARGICVFTSDDLGKTWSPLHPVDTASHPQAGMTTSPQLLNHGRLLLPLELPNENGVHSVGATETADGKTFGPIRTLVSDPAGLVNYTDAKFSRLDDGRLLMLCWVFRQQDEATLNVHQSLSNDEGLSWSRPVDTGLRGQIGVPAFVPGHGTVALTTYRGDPPGILLWRTNGSPTAWQVDSPLLFWDARRRTIAATQVQVATRKQAAGVWEALQGFTFGAPDLLVLPDATCLASFYTEDGPSTVIRAVRFSLG